MFKLLERVAAAQTINHLVTNNILPKFQSAYRPFHSSETALVRVFNDILTSVDKHKKLF